MDFFFLLSLFLLLHVLLDFINSPFCFFSNLVRLFLSHSDWNVSQGTDVSFASFNRDHGHMHCLRLPVFSVRVVSHSHTHTQTHNMQKHRNTQKIKNKKETERCPLLPWRQRPWDSCREWQKNNEALFVLQWRGVARQQEYDVGSPPSYLPPLAWRWCLAEVLLWQRNTESQNIHVSFCV